MAIQKVTVRRAPKLVAFVATGFLFGVVVAAIVSFGMPTDPAVGAGATFGFFAIMFSLVGMGAGAVVGLILDRSTRTHTATAEVSRTRHKDSKN